MGKISRYFQPVQQQYVSQFIPEDLGLMQRALQQRQSQADKTRGELDLYESSLLKESALPQYDEEQLKGIEKELSEFTQGISEKDLSSPAVRREVSRFIAKTQADPRLAKIRAGVATKAAYDKLKAKYQGTEFGYAVENDPMAQAYQQYLNQTGEGRKFASDFIAGKDQFQVGVDVYKNKEKFFNNISEAGRQALQSLGEGDLETFYKTGWTGKTAGKIKEVAQTEYDDYLGSPGGQQMIRRVRSQNPGIDNKQLDNLLFTDFLSTGMKRAGIKTTTGRAGALNSLRKKQAEKEAGEATVIASVGNVPFTEFNTLESESLDVDYLPTTMDSYRVLGGTISDVFSKVYKGLSEGTKIDDNLIVDSFNKNLKENIESRVDMSKVKEYTNTVRSTINSMSPQEHNNFINTPEEDRTEWMKNYLDQKASQSYEILSNVLLNPKAKAELMKQVQLGGNNYITTDMYKKGLGDGATVQDYIQEGYQIEDASILEKNPVSPGNRLLVSLVDDGGNRVQVASSGGLGTSTTTRGILPSESATYVGDNLERARLNSKDSKYVIPLVFDEARATKGLYNAKDFEAQGPNITYEAKEDSYDLTLNLGDRDYNVSFSTTAPKESETHHRIKILTSQGMPLEKAKQTVAHHNRHEAYRAKDLVLKKLSEIQSSPLSEREKMEETEQYFIGLSNLNN